jgi:hypothetical protein
MKEIIALQPRERGQVFQETATRMRIAAVSVEKDFWVCWTLEKLFALPGWKDHLTFKGGTSLSKAYGLLKRFSEDIDLVVDRPFLGFTDELPLKEAESNRAKNRWLQRLIAKSSEALREDLMPALQVSIGQELGATGWSLDLAPEEGTPEGNALLFTYPAVFGAGGYVNPIVKLELVARADNWPNEKRQVKPYVYDALQGRLPPCEVTVRTLSPVRTLWEKTLLLHEEYHRPHTKPRRQRLARHYYDLWALLSNAALLDAALSTVPELLPDIVAQREAFFKSSWGHFDTMKLGSLRVMPHPDHMNYWTNDYDAMGEEMIFGDRPSFDEILNTVKAFEASVNRNP